MILDVKLESCKIYLAKRSYILFYDLGWYYTLLDTKNTTKNWVWATKDKEIMLISGSHFFLRHPVHDIVNL